MGRIGINPFVLAPPDSDFGRAARRRLIFKLESVAKDLPLLWLPLSTDTTTTTDASLNARVFTYDATIAARIIREGMGVTVDFNGTTHEADTPDVTALSFGDSVVDKPFSVIALVKPDVNNVLMTITGKLESAAAEEYEFGLSASGHPQFILSDESATATIAGRDAVAAGTDWVFLVGTYDGTTAISGMRIYKNGLNRTLTNDSAGTYVAMENTAALVHLGARYAVKERFFNGRMGIVGLINKAITQDEVWGIKEVINGHFGLSL